MKAVTADQQGRIWIGASDGVRRWTPTGWDMIDGALGTPPTGPINAIAVDTKGRVWIGGENGLTLFDRERWVTTITPPTGSISVTAVLVDRDDNVWAGTAQGLAKLNTTDQTWTTYTTANNLYTNNIFDLQLLGDGKIAVSTSGVGRRPQSVRWRNFHEANVSARRGSTVDGRQHRSPVGGRDQSRTHRLLRAFLDEQRPDQ